MKQIHELAEQITAVDQTNYLATDNGTNTRKVGLDALGKGLLENYAGTTLAGQARSVKNAIDAVKASIPAVDATLATNGAAADAKAAGDAIGSLSTTATGLRTDLDSLSEDVDNLTDTVSVLETDLSQTDVYQQLLCDTIPNTVQSYIFTDGAVSQVTHKSGNTTVRTDAFVYASASITETRTLNTGQSLTIVTNLQTLETTVTYAAA